MAGFNPDLREVGWVADWAGNLKLGGMKRNAKDIQGSFAGNPFPEVFSKVLFLDAHPTSG